VSQTGDPTLDYLMSLFGGVPQEAQVNAKGAYQDQNDPLNDSLDTAQNLYSTLGFNIQDLLLPPEPAAPWVNDTGVAYGQSPLYSAIFADIEEGTDPITAVQNIMRVATPADAEGNPLEAGDPKVQRYVVVSPDGQIMDVPTKLWNQDDPMSGGQKAVVQLDLDALQGVAKDYATSMAEGVRYTAEQPDFGQYTNLDEIGGEGTVEDLKSRYAAQQLGQSFKSMPQDPAAPSGAPMKTVYTGAQRNVPGANDLPMEPAGSANARTTGARAQGLGGAPRQGNAANVQVPDIGVFGIRGSNAKKPPVRDTRTRVQKASAKNTSSAYNEQMDKIIATDGGKVVRNGKDRQRQLDALAAVMALPQIMRGG
jgi:hypothetical protein